jgi:zinc transporter ZupT
VRPLSQIYWIRAVLGLVAGAVGAVVALLLPANAAVSSFDQITPLLNSLTTALIIYIMSYYVLRVKFQNKLEKPSQVKTMGIGMFFFMWLGSMVLFYTIAYNVMYPAFII